MLLLAVDEEISLRLLSGIDAENLFKVTDASREYLREWLPWLDDTVTVEDSRQFIEHALTMYNNRAGFSAGIFYRDQLVGMAGYNSIDWRNGVGYIGYWLGADFQGHGIMTRVASALTDYGFQELKLNRVDIRAAVDNHKSRAIPKRLGYQEEGHIRQAEFLYNHYVDHVIYGMLAEEWEQQGKRR
ncbi:GNAT family N-acetyltransferase [Ornithinibacillus gellani]|uniref:GNAT family N-acetyltransferase n=1 Tax=Ornithinibacillus gellani TaxID=2293253 RepID=UPI000F4634E0|nr:GNAT family protein [Ornithinibacillus gellani]TQS76392.1 GNAT family N-acetyltransferase [Ornithinibacillus gellani]